MGHRDSSATLGRASTFRSSGDGTAAPAPQHRLERVPERAEPRGLSLTTRALLLAVRVYQTFFSALMPSACKFYPSCSQFAAEALQLHGARRGSWLALRRLSRCHPFTPGGVDLVPDAGNSSRATAQAKIHKHSGDEAHS
jgi:putative membrane protein insertion efficiency factor